MPFALLLFGTVLAISGVRGTNGDLFALLKGDLLGKQNFLYWMFAIIIIGSLGYIDSLRTFSRYVLVLIVIVLFLTNNKNGTVGFFTNFKNQAFGG